MNRPGYCFIRLGHWAACENIGVYRAVGPAEVLAGLNDFRNKVNVIRGAVPYMVTTQRYAFNRLQKKEKVA